MDVHVRLSEGQSCIYEKFPDRTCYVHRVHDSTTPVLYDVRIPIFSGQERDAYLYAQNILPNQLRAVDEIPLR